MHRIGVIGRPAALLALTAVLLALVAWFSGSAPQQDRAYADSDWAGKYWMSCTNGYLDLEPLQAKGAPPGVEDFIPQAASLNRYEPSQTKSGGVDISSISYLGVDTNGDNIPDAPPGELCDAKSAAALTSAQNGRLNNALNYQIVADDRPTAVAQVEVKGAETNLLYTSCAFSEALGTWLRTDITLVLTDKSPAGQNFGNGILYINVSGPTNPADPTTCGEQGTPYADMFPFVFIARTLDATTDHPELSKNAAGIAAGDLAVDPDGPNDPKPKDAKQLPDSADGLADDWDGDGCPDWDELDPNFHESEDLPNGLDPFNPHDCNQAVNVSGIYRIRATAIPASEDPDYPNGDPVPGAYFHCIGDMQQDASDLEMRLYCYTDSAAIPVNPEAGTDTGDGFEGGLPPPPYGDVDDVQSVLTGTLTSPGNDVVLSGCYEDRDGHSAVGNVYISSSQSAHSGRGTADIWLGQTTENCVNGTPVGDPSFPDAPIASVKVAEKGPCEKVGPQCAAGGLVDFDGDNCPDKNELSNNQQQGGLRDPYNRWDYMNPTGDGQNRVDDILATVNQYFIDAGNPSYTTHTDRTAVIGANPWNLGPPNGQQRVDDILASVKSYFHDCDGGKFDDPDDE